MNINNTAEERKYKEAKQFLKLVTNFIIIF